jgi:hypothetical protein
LFHLPVLENYFQTIKYFVLPIKKEFQNKADQDHKFFIIHWLSTLHPLLVGPTFCSSTSRLSKLEAMFRLCWLVSSCLMGQSFESFRWLGLRMVY